MGVYIRGMEMPTSCCQCPVNMYLCKRGYEYLLEHPTLYDERAKDCPLVPVPPHGDLIDYDFCMKNYELLHDDDGNPAYAVRMRDINNAPTIIEEER